jgi:hypothetical protein
MMEDHGWMAFTISTARKLRRLAWFVLSIEIGWQDRISIMGIDISHVQ